MLQKEPGIFPWPYQAFHKIRADIHVKGSFVDCTRCKSDKWPLVSDGHCHLGWAQMADAQRIGHLGLGSNIQPSLKWLMPYLSFYILNSSLRQNHTNFMVIHLCHAAWSYTTCTCSQFLHHISITCILDSILMPFLHVLT